MKLTTAFAILATLVSATAFASTTYHYPKSTNQYNQQDYIFVNATNGTQFCKEKKGSQSRIIDGEMFCGEDESSYNEFDWSSQSWYSKSTGSKNQCYPIFKEITCQ